jgi:hypothetical protein
VYLPTPSVPYQRLLVAYEVLLDALLEGEREGWREGTEGRRDGSSVAALMYLPRSVGEALSY